MLAVHKINYVYANVSRIFFLLNRDKYTLEKHFVFAEKRQQINNLNSYLINKFVCKILSVIIDHVQHFINRN